MIGFYYGRNPKTMQQDTVLQHSRMFGYRSKELLSVTRFYTTRRIHSNMEKITEIDMELRNEIEKGHLGSGVYFITQKKQDEQYGYGRIVPCSPDKIRISDIILLKPYKRIFPVGFTPVNITKARKVDEIVCKKLKCLDINENTDGKSMKLCDIIAIMHIIYSGIEPDEDSTRFVTEKELIVVLRYLLGEKNELPVIVRKGRKLSKYRENNPAMLSDAPDTPDPFNKARQLAIDTPVVMLLQETGEAEGWFGRPFWWPIVVVPYRVNKTIYASKLPAERIDKN